VSVGTGKYLLINTEHRENYDDFRISASDYGFLNGVDRFLSCSRLFAFGPSKIKQKVGMLSEADTKTVIEKIGASGRIGAADKAVIRAELLAASFSGSG
jgi:hypothetical protein